MQAGHACAEGEGGLPACMWDYDRGARVPKYTRLEGNVQEYGIHGHSEVRSRQLCGRLEGDGVHLRSPHRLRPFRMLEPGGRMLEPGGGPFDEAPPGGQGPASAEV